MLTMRQRRNSFQCRKRQKGACNPSRVGLNRFRIASFQCRKRQKGACNSVSRSPCGTSPKNGVLVNPDRFLPFSAFPNMCIVLFSSKNKAPSLAPEGISTPTTKSVNPQRSYAGLRGVRRVVLFHVNSLYMMLLFFASQSKKMPLGFRFAAYRARLYVSVVSSSPPAFPLPFGPAAGVSVGRRMASSASANKR